MTSELDLTGRVAIVTGATRGIGYATAQRLAAHGATLIITGTQSQSGDSRGAPAVGDVAETISRDAGVDVLGVTCDVRDAAAVEALYRTVFSAHKRLDVLVNNAGVLRDALVGMIDDAIARDTIDINLLGTVRNLQSAARLMRRSGGGSIINVSSIIGVTGNEGQVVYGASKAGVIGATLSAAKELAPHGIRVNAVAPGFIETDMTLTLSDDVRAQRVSSVKMGRAGTGNDVAAVIHFLASDLSRYVTGQVIGVDGGMLV